MTNTSDHRITPPSVIVRVFESAGPDGKRGGTPHLHLVAVESYFVLRGSGSVEMIDQNGFSSFDLEPHTLLTFTPGTLHRLVHFDEPLELLVLSEGGLPEIGDMIACLPAADMQDDDTFAKAMHVSTLHEAEQRRARAVTEFTRIRGEFEKGIALGHAALRQLFERAIARTASCRPRWEETLRAQAVATNCALARIASLSEAAPEHLLHAQQQLVHPETEAFLGCCGFVRRVRLPIAPSVRAGSESP